MASGTQLASPEFSLPFALSHDQQSFRFFELPDELVDLMTSGSNPRLYLKSANEASSLIGDIPQTKSADYVHLCSEDLDTSWSLRQVSTSNEVYVVQAMRPGGHYATTGDIGVEDADAGQDKVVLTAVAKTDSMLELLPAAVDIEAHLRKLLPTLGQDHLMRLFEKIGGIGQSQLYNEVTDELEAVASQIPAPDTSIMRVWRQLCVSQFPRSSAVSHAQHFIPTVQLLESAWNSAHAAYTIRTGGKGTMEQVDFQDDGEGLDELAQVKAAVWRCLVAGCGSRLDRQKTVTWVERTTWQSMHTSTAPEFARIEKRCELEDFWRNQLPQEWNDSVTVENLMNGTYELYTAGGDEMCRWIGNTEQALTAPAIRAKPGKRTWHEKFRAGRHGKT